MGAAIEVRGLVKRFADVTAVDGVSFEVKAGDSFGLAGPDGAGKTTLFRLLATLLPPTAGSAAINGFDVVQHTRDVRRSIGIVAREATSEPELTVEENLRTFAALHGVPAPRRASRIDDVLAAVELTASAGTPVRSLGADMSRRVELARALVHEPRVLLLDEPTAGLDRAARSGAWSVLKKVLSMRDLTVLLTTRDLDEARMLCSRVAEMEQGRIRS